MDPDLVRLQLSEEGGCFKVQIVVISSVLHAAAPVEPAAPCESLYRPPPRQGEVRGC